MDDAKTLDAKILDDKKQTQTIDRDYLKEKMRERAETEVPGHHGHTPSNAAQPDESLETLVQEVKEVTQKLEKRLGEAEEKTRSETHEK
jgi:hypothetical protein